MVMTEARLKKLDGKRIRFSINYFPHSINYKIYEGIVKLDTEIVNTYRNNKMISKEHYCFYLTDAILIKDTMNVNTFNEHLRQAPLFTFSRLKCITAYDILKDGD